MPVRASHDLAGVALGPNGPRAARGRPGKKYRRCDN